MYRTLNPFTQLLVTVIELYTYVLVAWVVLSLLISFNIVNRHQPIVQRINFALFRLTDPVIRPIRKRVPDLGSIDISPIIALLGLQFLRNMILYYS